MSKTKSIPIAKLGKHVITAKSSQIRRFEEYLEKAAAAVPKSILDEAKQATSIRPHYYGDPKQNCEHIASIASAILKRTVTPKEVCIIFIAAKISRQIHKHKRDNLVDLAGYAWAWSKLEGEQ